MEGHILKVAVAGWPGNPERAASMLNKISPKEMTFTYIGELKPFTKEYDAIIAFGSHPLKMLYLFTCSGTRIIRLCGSDWYKAYLGQTIHRILLWILPFHIMYASGNLARSVNLPGKVLELPVNTDHFYPRPVPRDLDTIYYAPPGKPEYYPDKAPPGATILDGTTPYLDMPELLSRHKRYIRLTTHDASPKLPTEAFLCGCAVWENGKQYLEVPDYMYHRIQIPRWIEYIRSIVEAKLRTDEK